MKYSGVEIVVARYQENVRWLESIPYELYDRITIYNKGPSDYETSGLGDLICKNLLVQNLPNFGQDIHAFLYHITQRYDSLAPVTVFLHGSSYQFPKSPIYNEIMYRLKAGKKNFIYVNTAIDKDLENFRILHWRFTNRQNSIGNSDSSLKPSKVFPYGVWYRSVFGPCETLPIPSYQSQFFVSKENIQKRPRDFYEQFLPELLESIRPELAHYIERAWPTLLHIPAEDILNLTPGNGNSLSAAAP
jgi:hypothetical protein